MCELDFAVKADANWAGVTQSTLHKVGVGIGGLGHQVGAMLAKSPMLLLPIVLGPTLHVTLQLQMMSSLL